MSTSTAPTLPFPHPVLTPISGEPTNTSLQLLQQELFANARAIFSTRGGGANGHLALVMPAPDYAHARRARFYDADASRQRARPPPGRHQRANHGDESPVRRRPLRTHARPHHRRGTQEATLASPSRPLPPCPRRP
ncbi:MAG: hypothetical protein MZV70_62560 [Desulfobacterales bacterium]|nr:hypothetical protein [Desulfobacterales bacterium]